MVARWPEQAGLDDADAEAQMNILMDAVRAIRNSRAEYNVPPGKRIVALIAAGQHRDLLLEQRAILSLLAKLEDSKLRIFKTKTAPAKAVTLVVGTIAVHLPLAGLVDLDAERARLSKELQDAEQRIARSEQLLANPGFAERAPEQIVQRERDKLADLLTQRQELESRLQTLAS